MTTTNETPDRDVQAGLEAAFPAPDAAEAARLHDLLARRAERDGLLDVAYRTVDSPIGELLLAATDHGLVRVAFEVEDHDAVLEELAGAVSPRILRSAPRTDEVARELDEYFAGTRHRFDVPVDLQLASGFRRTVLEHLAAIAYGRTESYAEVARAAGSPGAVRAVGTACARNPVPLVVPCHRVVRSDGTSGQYRGGAAAKLALLALEQAA
ncbi:methylated-DNA--[protein]-cysteine S-methyltransferase [Aquihabitans sp. G128]|uniref:methylated-DNA--[protein]-cysteine S-methyltransferase n=1 Tax=Aquihabitans sp. G128 TaxID=2849779 RepID=UPI001C222A8E|nr:methylated-DNA--[protein]-cysteine S-methyltransferase [Aquihabitans sp. G128]QXC60734.1 methylated-DNA--[protein]-cysteine S-methyltransferase [Aquihabitans sp. G128]